MKTLAIASVKSTKVGVTTHQGKSIPVLQGHALSDIRDNLNLDSSSVPKKVTVFPGSVPTKLPSNEFWQKAAFNFISFSPEGTTNKHESLPHIRMDQVLQFLLADKMV